MFGMGTELSLADFAGLACDVLKRSAAVLASLIFGTWMNISGSTPANFWRQRAPRVREAALAQQSRA
jgi:predicted Na+-dependent transporter